MQNTRHATLRGMQVVCSLLIACGATSLVWWLPQGMEGPKQC